MRVFLANLILFLSSGLANFKWKRNSKIVSVAQKQYLFELLKKNEKTKFGIEHNFSEIDSIDSFQDNVPISSYEDILPYIDLISKGESNVLTEDQVYIFGVSSGSTSASKLIPYTKDLSNEFQSGIGAWFWRLFTEYPKILLGRTYWSISPVGQNKKKTDGGIPIGFDDEKMYFSKFSQLILDTIQIAPVELSLILDMDSFRYATMRFLLNERNLTWISLWNPTFIPLIFSTLRDNIERLIVDIRNGTLSCDLGLDAKREESLMSKIKSNPKRSTEISKLLIEWKDKDFKELNSKGFTFYESLWPNLKLLSCWADGAAIESLPNLIELFPNSIVQPKGLLATEAFVSFPYSNEFSALSINSHFFEFKLIDDIDIDKIFLAHQLVVGEKYEVIVTTGGGFYRYRLGDVVTVFGYVNECPLIRFTSRKDKVVDVMGEKLNETFVKTTITSVFESFDIKPSFWMVSPEKTNNLVVFYSLFIKSSDKNISLKQFKDIADNIEIKFSENYHYNYCRQLGQLNKLKVFQISDDSPEEVYLSTCQSFGQRLGDIKNTALHPYKEWSSRFLGKFVC